MNSFFRWGGIAASVLLIAFGAGSIVVGLNGRDQVRSDLAREQIVGTRDSTIPGKLVDTGSEAQAFAKVMRKHTLEATKGQTYAQMARYVDATGKPTNDDTVAATDPKSGEPMANPARNLWVTETALTTALNTAYFAESVSMFVVVIGGALLLVGIGFLVLIVVAGRRTAQPAGEPEVAASRQPVTA